MDPAVAVNANKGRLRKTKDYTMILIKINSHHRIKWAKKKNA